jgi:hypothetical protein
VSACRPGAVFFHISELSLLPVRPQLCVNELRDIIIGYLTGYLNRWCELWAAAQIQNAAYALLGEPPRFNGLIIKQLAI